MELFLLGILFVCVVLEIKTRDSFAHAVTELHSQPLCFGDRVLLHTSGSLYIAQAVLKILTLLLLPL